MATKINLIGSRFSSRLWNTVMCPECHERMTYLPELLGGVLVHVWKCVDCGIERRFEMGQVKRGQ